MVLGDGRAARAASSSGSQIDLPRPRTIAMLGSERLGALRNRDLGSASRSSSVSRISRPGRRRLTLMLVLAGWEALSRAGLLNPVIVGAPSLCLRRRSRTDRHFFSRFGITAYEMLLAAAIAWTAGSRPAPSSGPGPQLRACSRRYSPALIALPLIVLYPVVVAWTGIGPISKIVYAAAAGFFPIALATVSGHPLHRSSLCGAGAGAGGDPPRKF